MLCAFVFFRTVEYFVLTLNVDFFHLVCGLVFDCTLNVEFFRPL